MFPCIEGFFSERKTSAIYMLEFDGSGKLFYHTGGTSWVEKCTLKYTSDDK